MKPFDIYEFDGKYKPVKQGQACVGTLLTTIHSPNSSAALKRFKTLIKSGQINLEQCLNEARSKDTAIKREDASFSDPNTTELRKAIYCDFNGVLDDFELGRNCNEWDVDFRLPKIVHIDRLISVVKLAIKHNAQLVISSDWRKHGIVYYNVLKRAIHLRGTEEQAEWLKENRKTIRELCCDSTGTSKNDDRDLEIREHIRDNKITHCVVFEDDRFISEALNPVMVYHPGLSDEHIELADKILACA